MPYTGADDSSLPDKVKKMPQHDKEIWVAAFNNSYKGCIDDGGTADDCEGSAFAIAYSAVEKAKKESKMKVSLRAFVERIFNRTIKEVSGWDGSASNYKDTNAYCSACLIDVNSSETKTQDHCMLPVREEGDPATTFVKQAIHAAAGGHGITQVKKPDDVEQETWDAAVKAAANKIITAYNEMDEVAPDAVYELAGKEKPEEESRAKSIDEAFWDLGSQVYEMDDYGWLNGVFVDDSKMFAIISSGGKLYRAEISLAGDALSIGDKESWYEVKLDFPPIQEKSRTLIQRQSDGRYRWLSISCSAVLNRSGELDSRALFDSFIKHAEETGEYPIREFFHAGEKFRIGQCDFIARDDYLLITSGIYDDSDLGRAEVRARQENPDYWGDSIGFLPTKEPEKIRVAEGVNILAYDEGVLHEISTLPEQMAAAWFTATPTIMEVNRMLTQTQKDTLAKLMGSSVDDVEKWLEDNSATRNRTIEQENLITRANDAGTEAATETQPQSQPAATQPAPDAGQPAQSQEYIFTEESFSELVSRVGAGLDERIRAVVAEANIAEQIQQMQETLQQAIGSMAEEIDRRLKALEAGDDEKRKIWLQDAPKISLRQTTRPRDPAPGTEPEGSDETMADQAARVLEKAPHWGPKS